MSILQNILNKVSGQVNEDFFRQQLIQELGIYKTLMMTLQIQVDLLWPIIFFYLSSTDKTTIL